MIVFVAIEIFFAHDHCSSTFLAFMPCLLQGVSLRAVENTFAFTGAEENVAVPVTDVETAEQQAPR